MTKVMIIDAVWSLIGKVCGALSVICPDDLLADVLKGLITPSGIGLVFSTK